MMDALDDLLAGLGNGNLRINGFEIDQEGDVVLFGLTFSLTGMDRQGFIRLRLLVHEALDIAEALRAAACKAADEIRND